MNTRQAAEDVPEISLHGGPLYGLGCRLGLVRGKTNTVMLGVALGALLWIVLAGLALLENLGDRVFSLQSIAGHVRLLLVIPLLFMCESALDPAVQAFIRSIVRPGVVPADSLPALRAALARTTRWRNSWVPDALCLLAAILMSISASRLNLIGATAAWDPDTSAPGFVLTAWWYWAICLTVFRFLLFRWLWRLMLWWFLLWRISRLKLELVPAHGDGAAGLGYAEFVHSQFIFLIAAISVHESAALAEAVAAGSMAINKVQAAIALVLVADAIVFLAPLLILAPGLWVCRQRGLSDYSDLAARYAISFDDKWLRNPPRAEELLGTSDVQSLMDMAGAMGVVRRMRLAPWSLRLLLGFAAAALVPMLPLLLFKYPVAELAQRFFSSLSGL